MNSYKFLGILKPPTGNATCLCYDQTETKLIVGTDIGGVHVFDLENKTSVSKAAAEPVPVRSIGCDEDTIYTFNDRGEIDFWDHTILKKKREAIGLPKNFVLDSKNYLGQSLFATAKGGLIVDCRRESFWDFWGGSNLYFLDLKSGEWFRWPDIGRDIFLLHKLSLSADGKHLFVSGIDFSTSMDGDWLGHEKCISKWDLGTRAKVQHFSLGSESSSPSSVPKIIFAFSRDETRLLAIYDEYCRKSVELRVSENDAEDLGFDAQSDIYDIEWAPGDEVVAIAHEQSEVTFWDVSNRRAIFHEPAFPGSIKSICFAPSGQFAAVLLESSGVAILRTP